MKIKSFYCIKNASIQYFIEYSMHFCWDKKSDVREQKESLEETMTKVSG